MLETSLITPVDTLMERVEHTPIEPFVDEVSFPIEVLGDTEVSGALIEFPDNNHLLLHGKNAHGRELVMEGRVVTHDEPMMEEDEQ